MKKIIEFFKRLFGGKQEVVKPAGTGVPKNDVDVNLNESKPKPKKKNYNKSRNGGSSSGNGRQPYNID